MSLIDRLSANGTSTRLDDDELAQVLDDYLAEVEAGRPVDVEAWVGLHPVIADRLRACLKGLHLVEEVAGAIGPVGTGKAATGAGPQLGDFQILRTLGRGGMGVVFEAVQHSLGRHVALKVLPFGAAFDPRHLARFRVESQAAAQLHHTHIVPVYSVGCERGVHYYAMQLIDGSTLAEIIANLRQTQSLEHRPTASASGAAPAGTDQARDRGREAGSPDGSPGPGSDGHARGWTALSSMSTRTGAYFREIARLGLHAAEALEHAHQNGVLHRDVKPSNLMVDSRGHLWVTDFGLARFQGEGSLTQTGDLLGTLRYMSPEQSLANSSVVDQRTDVYSLGATLYELLTLQPAFEGSDRQELLRRIAREEPRRPRGLNPVIPADLETIVLKAMAKEPVSRYATAAALAEDLRRFLEDQPILARRPGPIERLARLARRHVRVVMAVLPLLVVMVIGLTCGIVLVLAEQAEILSKQAEIQSKKDEVERSRAEVKRQRDDARRAVDDMYTDVAESWLSRQTNLQPLQRDFLLKALAYYERAARENDADPAIRLQRGLAALRVGVIQRTLGKLELAEAAFRQTQAILGEEGNSDEQNSQTLDALARSYVGLADVLSSLNKSAESQKAVNRAVEFTQRFIEKSPESPVSLPTLTYHHEQLGELLRFLGRTKEAEAAYRKAIELGNAIANPNRMTRAVSTSSLAQVLEQTGRLAEAQQLHRRAVELHEALVTQDPGMPLYRQGLARTLSGLANLLSKQKGQEPETERVIRRAMAVYDRLATDAPDVPVYRRELGITLLDLGKLLDTLGRLSEAEDVLRRPPPIFEALVAESPNVPILREKLAVSLSELANVQRQAGETKIAISNARKAQAIYDALQAENPQIWRNIAKNLGYLAELLTTTESHKEAEPLCRRALAIAEKLAAEHPADVEVRSDLATYLHQVAYQCFRTAKTQEADRTYRQALALSEKLVRESPERSQDWLNLAHVAANFGGFCFQNNRMEECERVTRRGLEAYEHLITENFRRAEMLRGAAMCLGNLAVAQIAANREKEGEYSYRRALELLDSLPAKVSGQLEARINRGNIQRNLAAQLVRTARKGEAESLLRQAEKVQAALAAEFPDRDGYRGALALTRSHLGAILADRGQTSEARTLLTQAVELQQAALRSNPHDPIGQMHLCGERKILASFLLKQRAHAEAAAVTEDLMRGSAMSPDVPAIAATCLTQCTFLAWQDEKLPNNRREESARAYARRARDILRRLIDEGKEPTAAPNLCWFLVVCPASELRDPALAVRLARQTIEKFPDNTKSKLLLGAALYRAGNWEGAALQLAAESPLAQVETGFWAPFLAMAEWQLGHKEIARQTFESLKGWRKANPAQLDGELLFQEAAALLELAERGPPVAIDQKKTIEAH